MSRDAKNSIILWAGTLALMGVVWALLQLDIGAHIPDRWVWPMMAVVIGLNVARSIWDRFRRRNAKFR
jgi:hypothetical protein